jgi:hypothetical protein
MYLYLFVFLQRYENEMEGETVFQHPTSLTKSEKPSLEPAPTAADVTLDSYFREPKAPLDYTIPLKYVFQ